MIKGKQPEEIRKLFNIQNDFTPEEEAQIRRENVRVRYSHRRNGPRTASLAAHRVATPPGARPPARRWPSALMGKYAMQPVYKCAVRGRRPLWAHVGQDMH